MDVADALYDAAAANGLVADDGERQSWATIRSGSSAGQRLLHRHADYVSPLVARGLPSEPFAGYPEAFAHGIPPHGGCALGLERWVARIADVANIRETALFPRDINRLTP